MSNIQRWEVSGYYKQEFDFVVGLQRRGFEVLPSYDGNQEALPFPDHADVGVESRYDYAGKRGRFLVPIGGEGAVFEQCPDNYSFFARRSQEPVAPWRTCHGKWADGVLTVIPEQGEQFTVDLPSTATDLHNLADQGQKKIASDWVLGLYLVSVEADLDELKKNAGLPRISSDHIILPVNSIAVDVDEKHLVGVEVYSSDKGVARAFSATLCNNKVTSLRCSGVPDYYTMVVETPKKKYQSVTKVIGDTNTGVGTYLSPFVVDTAGDSCYLLRDKEMDDKEFYHQLLVRLQNNMNVPIQEDWVMSLSDMALHRGVIRRCVVWGDAWTDCLYINLNQDEWIALVNDAIREQVIAFSFNVGSLPDIKVDENDSNEPVTQPAENEWDNGQELENEELPIWPD